MSRAKKRSVRAATKSPAELPRAPAGTGGASPPLEGGTTENILYTKPLSLSQKIMLNQLCKKLHGGPLFRWYDEKGKEYFVDFAEV